MQEARPLGRHNIQPDSNDFISIHEMGTARCKGCEYGSWLLLCPHGLTTATYTQEYDKDNIAPNIITAIRPYLDREEFKPEVSPCVGGGEVDGLGTCQVACLTADCAVPPRRNTDDHIRCCKTEQ
jgi:hypothetical protein